MDDSSFSRNYYIKNLLLNLYDNMPLYNESYIKKLLKRYNTLIEKETLNDSEKTEIEKLKNILMGDSTTYNNNTELVKAKINLKYVKNITNDKNDLLNKIINDYILLLDNNDISKISEDLLLLQTDIFKNIEKIPEISSHLHSLKPTYISTSNEKKQVEKKVEEVDIKEILKLELEKINKENDKKKENIVENVNKKQEELNKKDEEINKKLEKIANDKIEKKYAEFEKVLRKFFEDNKYADTVDLDKLDTIKNFIYDLEEKFKPNEYLYSIKKKCIEYHLKRLNDYKDSINIRSSDEYKNLFVIKESLEKFLKKIKEITDKVFTDTPGDYIDCIEEIIKLSKEIKNIEIENISKNNDIKLINNLISSNKKIIDECNNLIDLFLNDNIKKYLENKINEVDKIFSNIERSINKDNSDVFLTKKDHNILSKFDTYGPVLEVLNIRLFKKYDDLKTKYDKNIDKINDLLRNQRILIGNKYQKINLKMDDSSNETDIDKVRKIKKKIDEIFDNLSKKKNKLKKDKK